MGIFSVATKNEENDAILKARITENFPSDYYEIGRGQWLIAFSGTAKELYLKLFPVNVSGIVVFGVGGYWGHTSRDMWEWLATKLGAKSA